MTFGNDGDYIKKRRRGPTPKSSDELRHHSVSCRLTDAELVKLDGLRGSVRRGEWLRLAAFGKAPRPVPSLNIEAWRELARTASNLNQLAHSSNADEEVDGVELADVLSSLRTELNQIRLMLIGGAS